MVTTILDGYNVIHAVPELARSMDRSLQSARDALVRVCQEARGRRGEAGPCYVVFDGRDAQASGSSVQQQGRVTVLFTRKPEEADQRILRVIEDQKGRGRCVVVSNDNEVANNARAFGARVISAQEFYRQTKPPAARSPHASASKVMPSVLDAQQITDEYRKHLEEQQRGGPHG